jgi:hypothetical protein
VALLFLWIPNSRRRLPYSVLGATKKELRKRVAQPTDPAQVALTAKFLKETGGEAGFEIWKEPRCRFFTRRNTLYHTFYRCHLNQVSRYLYLYFTTFYYFYY